MTRSDKTSSQNFIKVNNQSLIKKHKSKTHLFSVVSPNLNLLNSSFILSTKTNFSLFAQTFFSHLFGFFVGRPTLTLLSNEIHILKTLIESSGINSSDKRVFFKAQNLRSYWTRKISSVAEIVNKDRSKLNKLRPTTSYLSPIRHAWSYLWLSDYFLNLSYFRLIGSITNKTFKPFYYQDYTFPKIYKKWKRRRRKVVFKSTPNLITRKQFLSSASKLRILEKLNRFDSFFMYNSFNQHSPSAKSFNVLFMKKRVLRLKPRTKFFRDRMRKRALKSFFRIPSSSKKRMFDHRHSSFLKLFYTLTSSAKFNSKVTHSSKKLRKKSSIPLSQSFERHSSTHYLSYSQFFSRNLSYTFTKRSYLFPRKKTPSRLKSRQFKTLFNLWSNSVNEQNPFYTREKRLTVLTRRKYPRPRRRLFISEKKKSYTTKVLPILLKLRLDRYKHHFISVLRAQPEIPQPELTKKEKKRMKKIKEMLKKKQNPLKLSLRKNKRLLNFKLFTKDISFIDIFDILYNLSFRQSYFYGRFCSVAKWGTKKSVFKGLQPLHLHANFYQNSPLITKKLNKNFTRSSRAEFSYGNIITRRYNKLLLRKTRLLLSKRKLITTTYKGVRKSSFYIHRKIKGQRRSFYLTRFRIITKKVMKYSNIQYGPFVGLARRTSYGVRSRLPRRRFILKKTTPQMRFRAKKRKNVLNWRNFHLNLFKYSRNSFNLRNFKSRMLEKSFVQNFQNTISGDQSRVAENISSNKLTTIQIFNPFKNATSKNSHVKLNFRLLTPTKLKSFRRGSYFLVQLLSVLKSLPEVHLTARKKFFYSDPFNFVDYKRLKKTVFRRLIMQRTKMMKSPFRFTSRGLSYLDPNPRLLNQFDYGRYPFNYGNFRRRTSIFNYKTHYKLFFGRMKPYYDYRGGDSSDTPTFIRKIRFKPGYQRMWRRERNIFKETFKLTHRYQYRLTPKIQLMYYPTRYTLLKSSKFQLKLSYALVLSRLASDQWTSDLLIDNKYVYLNGTLVTNGSTMIFPNDFLQLIISLRFYVLHRWLHMLASQRFNSWLRRYYKTYRIKKQLFKDFTFRSLPDSVLNLQNSFHDVPKTMEVDYFTLSSFILYSSKEYNLTHPFPINVFRLYVINMYNWKYLT